MHGGKKPFLAVLCSLHGVGLLYKAPEGTVPCSLGSELRLRAALAVQVGNETVEAGGRVQVLQPAPRDFTAEALLASL